MNAFGEKIAALIGAQGPVSVAQFMSLAVQEYYGKGDVFGLSGDFTTAPEISQMFGEMLGVWVANCWQEQGKTKRIQLVEFGPGRGTLMADMLRVAKRVAPDFEPEVVLIESSGYLKNIQQIKLQDARAPVRWATHFEKEMEQLPLFFVANEFFDALPIRQYVKTDKGWCERMVTISDGKLAFALAPIASGIERDGEPGAVLEVCPSGAALVEEVGTVIAERGGAGLILDYGHGGGLGDTLQAVGRHRFAELLETPGEVDITAHVDFAALAQAAARSGARAYGPVEQGGFLKALGIETRAEQLKLKNPGAEKDVDAALERLTGAGAMGTLFKALSIMPDGFRPVGF